MDKVHESVEVAKLDAAKFIIGTFATADKKPAVYDAAIKYIESAISKKE